MNVMTYIVTLNWNTTGLLKFMAQSVRETTQEPHAWVIIDNGSDEENLIALYDWAHEFFTGDFAIIKDDHVEIGRAWDRDAPLDDIEAIIVRSDENLGCVKGHNLAFDVVRMLSDGIDPELVEIVMIDTDVLVTETGWLSKAREWAYAHPAAGVIGLEHGPNHVCSGAVFLDTNGNWYLHEDQMMRHEPAEGESAGLGFALIRWPVVEAGLRFDTGFEMYYKQDDDFCFQVRADLGLEVWTYPVGNIHYGSGSLKANEYQCGDAGGWNEFDEVKQRNQAYFTKKWRWALKDRRRNMDEQAKHLAEMKQVMAERRKDG